MSNKHKGWHGGKGSSPRSPNSNYADNWEKIFGNTKSRYEQYDFRPDEHDAHYE